MHALHTTPARSMWRYEHVRDFHCWFYKTFPHIHQIVILCVCDFLLFQIGKYSWTIFILSSLSLFSSLPSLSFCRFSCLALCWDFIKISFPNHFIITTTSKHMVCLSFIAYKYLQKKAFTFFLENSSACSVCGLPSLALENEFIKISF